MSTGPYGEKLLHAYSGARQEQEIVWERVARDLATKKEISEELGEAPALYRA